MSDGAQHTIHPRHAHTLEKSAIDPTWAEEEAGIFSVEAPGDYPPEVRQGFSNAPFPALLFPLTRLDGTQIWQARLDNPPVGEDGKEVSKYQQWKGTGAVLTFPPGHHQRVGEAKTVLIVEGTKQTLAVSRYVDEDTLVVGIQGCQNWQQQGAPIEELQEVVAGADKVEFAFDADVNTNVNVWEAAKKLLGVLKTQLLVEDVRVLSLAEAGGNRKVGMDDWLGQITTGDKDSKRREALANLRRSAKKTLPARPRTTAQSSKSANTNTLYVSDLKTATTYTQATKPDPDDASKRVPAGEVTTLLDGCAARISRIEQWVDEEESGKTPPAVLSLDVAVRGMDGQVQFIPNAIRTTSSGLADVNNWLDNVPGQYGALISRPLRPSEDVANAIRASSHHERPSLVSLLGRFGWWLDRHPDDPEDALVQDSSSGWRWVAPNGGIGAQGVSEQVQARPPAEDFAAITPPDPTDYTQEQIAGYVRRFIELRNLFQDPSHWDVMVACMATAFLPGTPNVAVGIFGLRSSGKSTLAQGLMSALNPKWGISLTPMATFDASATAMDLLAAGMTDCLLHVDDLKPESDHRSRTEMLKGLDALLRRAHGAGGRRRGMVDRSTDRIGTRATDSSTPLVIVTGEEVPTGGDFAESGLDRMLVVKVEPNGMFKDRNEGFSSFKKTTQEGWFPIVLSAYLQYLAIWMDSMAETVGQLPTARRKVIDFIENQVDGWVEESGERPDIKAANVSTRGIRLIASLLAGNDVWFNFAEGIGAYGKKEIKKVRKDFIESLHSKIIDHTRQVMGGNADPASILIDRLRQMVASGVVTLDPSNATVRPLVGVETKADGEKALALNPAPVAVALGLSGGVKQVIADLTTVLIPDKQGNPTRTVKINGQSARMVVIPMSAWELPDAGADSSADGADMF